MYKPLQGISPYQHNIDIIKEFFKTPLIITTAIFVILSFTLNFFSEIFYCINNINNLTKERALYLRFGYWDKEKYPNLMLFPLWLALLLPYGTKVVTINGDDVEYTKDTDLDIRFGCVAFGANIKD